jgi:hypothetical protein
VTEPTVARCATCGTQYTARGWYWLEPLDRGGDRRTCAVPGCGFPVERARATALRLASEALSPANDPVIDEPMRSESEMKQPHNTAKKKPGRKPPPPPAATDDTPAMISIRGHSPADYAAFERARARISAKAGGAFISLSQAVLVLARTQAEREDAEERARAAALAGDPRDELIRNLVAARRKVEESTSDDWTGTVDDRMRLVQAEDDALAALARTVVVV